MALKRVLLVDDELLIRRVGQVSLEKLGGLEVLLAGSGPEALEIAARESPDLILLDVMMPAMDGPATLARLREPGASTAGIPVIFMTAKVQRHETERYRTLGALGVIAKPFDPVALPEEIARLFAGQPGAAEPR